MPKKVFGSVCVPFVQLVHQLNTKHFSVALKHFLIVLEIKMFVDVSQRCCFSDTELLAIWQPFPALFYQIFVYDQIRLKTPGGETPQTLHTLSWPQTALFLVFLKSDSGSIYLSVPHRSIQYKSSFEQSNILVCCPYRFPHTVKISERCTLFHMAFITFSGQVQLIKMIIHLNSSGREAWMRTTCMYPQLLAHLIPNCVKC